MGKMNFAIKTRPPSLQYKVVVDGGTGESAVNSTSSISTTLADPVVRDGLF